MTDKTPTLQEVRVANLRRLLSSQGSVASLSKRLNLSPIHIYNILRGNMPLRDILARNIELACLLAPGALDESRERNMDDDVPMLSLKQRVTKPVQAKRRVDGKVVNVTSAKVSTQTREELIEGVLDNLEKLAQAKGVGLLDHQKARLLTLVAKRLIDGSVKS